MADRYTNIRQVIDNVMAHPMLQDLTLERVVNYAVDFIRIVGAPTMFEEKYTCLKIEKFRAKLPCDFHQIIQVRKKEGPALRYATDTFHMGNYIRSKDDCKKGEAKGYKVFDDPTYKIQGDIIYTSFEKGVVEMSYEAMAVDKDGFPLIPENSSFMRALELYIKKQWFTILFDLGKINAQVLQNTQQEYSWAVGDCQTEFIRLTIDKTESLCNSLKTLLIREGEHDYGFKSNGARERLKLH